MDIFKLFGKKEKKSEGLNKTKSVFQSSSIQVNKENNNIPPVQNMKMKQTVNKRAKENVSKDSSANFQRLKANMQAGKKKPDKIKIEVAKKQLLKKYYRYKNDKNWQKNNPQEWERVQRVKAIADRQEEKRLNKEFQELDDEVKKEAEDRQKQSVENQVSNALGEFFKSGNNDNDSVDEEIEALEKQNEQEEQDSAKAIEIEKSDQQPIVIEDYMENPEKYQEKKKISMDMTEKSATVQQRVEEIQTGREQKEKEENLKSLLQALSEEDEEIDIMDPVPQEFIITEKRSHEPVKSQEQKELEEAVEREKKYNDMPEKAATVQQRVDEIQKGRKLEEQKIAQEELEGAVEREKKYNDMPEKSATVQQRVDEIQRGRDLEEQKIAQKEQEEIQREILEKKRKKTELEKEKLKKQSEKLDKMLLEEDDEEEKQVIQNSAEAITKKTEELQRKVDLLVKGREQIETEEAVEREKKFIDMPKEKSATVQQRVEEIEKGREQEIIKKEALKQELPLTVNAKKVENLKQNDNGKQEMKEEGGIRRLKPGEALARYIEETRSKQESEKDKKRKSMLEEALQNAEECCEQIRENSWDLDKLKDNIRLLDAAIIKVDGYIKKSKRFGHKDVTPPANAEERSLREAAKMLRIQLFLEKTVLYEKIDKVETIKNEDIDEMKLYRMQLDADARMKLYDEYMGKNKAEKEEADKKKSITQDMMDRKNKQLIAENSRQMELYSGKISESEKQAKLLQEKIVIKGYSVRHKQFNRNEVYKQQVEIKMAKLRPVIVKEWLDDNFQQIKDNVGKLIKEIEKDAKDANKLKGIKELEGLDKLLQADLKDDENLAALAMQYQKFFNNMAQMKDGTISLIPREIRDFMAAQIVLFEKRDLLKKDYNDALAKKDEAEKQQVVPKKDEAEKQQVVPKKDEAEKQQVVPKKDEKEKVEERIEEREKKEGLNGKPDESQALVKYSTVYDHMEKQKEIIGKQAPELYNTIMSQFSSYITSMQKGTVTKEMYQNIQKLMNNFISNISIKAPKLNEEMPIVINLTMQFSNQDFDKIFRAVVQKWNSIRPFRQARKLLAAPQDVKVEEIAQDVSVKEENNASDMSLNELAEELQKVQLHEETEKKDTQEVQGVEQAETRKSVRDIFAESIKEIDKEQQSRQRSKTDEELDTKEAKKQLMKKIEEKLEKERLARERQNQSDITEKEKEAVADKKKEEDLEFQRNNNEYGLQGMASEEKEKLDKQKERNEKARIEELERIHKEFDKTHERIDELTKQIEELRDTRYLGYYSAQGNAVGDALAAMDQAQSEYMEAERKMLIEHMEAQLRILEKIGEVEEYDMDQYNFQEEYHKEFEYAEDMQHELDAKKEEFMKQSEAYEKAKEEYATWFRKSLTQVQNLKANSQGMGSMINALEEGMEQMKIEEILYELAKDEENSEETLEMQDIADAVKLIKGIEQAEDENLHNEELLGEYMEKSGRIAKISNMIQEAYGNWMENKNNDMSEDK